MVFRIEVHTSNFSVRLLIKKLDKIIKATKKVLKEIFISFINMQLLVKFLSFYFQVIRLGQGFIQKLWHFINKYPYSAFRTSLKCIFA